MCLLPSALMLDGRFEDSAPEALRIKSATLEPERARGLPLSTAATPEVEGKSEARPASKSMATINNVAARATGCKNRLCCDEADERVSCDLVRFHKRIDFRVVSVIRFCNHDRERGETLSFWFSPGALFGAD